MINSVGSSPTPHSFAINPQRPAGHERTGSVFKQKLQEELRPFDTPATPQSREFRPAERPEPLVRREAPVASTPASLGRGVEKLNPMVNEVCRIAESVGYVGVTPQDVVRAYQSGHSFLADYTV